MTMTINMDEDLHVTNIEDGTYLVELKKFSKPYISNFKGKETEKTPFIFVIVGGEYHGEELMAGVNLAGRGEKASLPKILTALMGTLPEGEFDLETLIGKRCRAVVAVTYKENGASYANITSYLPLPPAKQKPGAPAKAATPPPPTPPADEADDDF